MHSTHHNHPVGPRRGGLARIIRAIVFVALLVGFAVQAMGRTGEPILRGNYVIDNKGNYHLDMASKVVATKKYLKIWIRKNANWYWQGHKATPVTAADYIYTWRQFVTPTNNVSSNTGYANIAKAKASGKKVVTFTWRKTGCTATTPCGAFADYRDLFGGIYPGFALKGGSSGCGW